MMKFFNLKIFKSIWIKILLVILGVFLVIHLVFRFTPYPEFEEFKTREYSTQFFDRNGILLQVSSIDDGIKREYTPLKKIPKQIRKVFLKAEDKRFYLHDGVDITAIITAFFQNKSSGRTVRGASTITMQLVKIINKSNEKTLKRKINDALNAYKLEARLTKNQILEYYLNSVPFGMNAEGITSAARTFFSKELKDLTLEETCCLAVIPRRPTDYNPVLNPGNCAERAYDLCYEKISKKVNPQNFIDTAKRAEKFKFPFYAPHYIRYIQNQYKKQNKPLPNQLTLSIDFEIQEFANGYLEQALEQAKSSRISNAALLLIDNKDGSIISWIGNNDFFDNSNSGQIDGVLVYNQMGSSMKPFLYAMALETTTEDNEPLYIPTSILADIPKEFGNEELYIPANFNNRFNGPIRLRIALASSLNIPAVSILNDIGIDNYLFKLYDLGFESLKTTGQDKGLGLSLGAGEVSLYELTRAFAVFPRDGLSLENKQIYDKDTARIICNILSDKSARVLGFGYTQTFQTEYPSIFKTGTANQYQNIVALGSTPEYTIGVWMGNFSGETVVGKTGSSLPGWVAKNILDTMVQKTNHFDNVYPEFIEPEHYHKEPVCSLTGKKAGEFCKNTVMEYVKDGTTLETCSWHKKIDNQITVVYPAEYQQWANYYGNSYNVDYNSSKLTLLTPKDNSLYYYNPLQKESQALPVELIGGFSDSLKIYYDGNYFKTISRPFKFYLPVEIGQHFCKMITENEEIHFSYTVQ